MDRMAQAVRRWRERANVSPEALAVLTGRSLSTVRRWERGEIDPRYVDLLRMESECAGLIEELFNVGR